MVRNVTSGGEGLYRTTTTGSSSDIGVKSMTPGMDPRISMTCSGQWLSLDQTYEGESIPAIHSVDADLNNSYVICS